MSQTVPQIENEGTLHNEFYESRITLNPKLNANYHDKYQDKDFLKHTCKMNS